MREVAETINRIMSVDPMGMSVENYRRKIRNQELRSGAGSSWCRRPRVLLVEPWSSVGFPCRVILSRLGFRALWVPNVKWALAFLQTNPFDAVVTEWKLFPDGSGLD